jgi:predicted dienelactone hydrolase
MPCLAHPVVALFAALLLTANASAQVGYAERQAADLSYTLVYPTEAVSRPTPFGPVTLDVAVDAPPAPGVRRLVVMSHGTGGSATTDHALARALVLQGLVVAQPLHRGDNYRDARDAGPAAFERRPREVIEVINALARDGQWAPRLALGRVGVHGMSAGGVTGLALAGAQWRTLNLVRHCLAHGDADVGFCLQGAVTPEQRAQRQARYERARHVPELFLPKELKAWHGGREPSDSDASKADPRPDPRIAAVTLAVPVAAIFSAESLARIAIPIGVVSATHDEVLVPRFHAEHVLAHCKRCTRLAELQGAGHFDVLWPWPPSVAQAVAAAQVRGGLPRPGFDAAQREAAQARIAAFMREALK